MQLDTEIKKFFKGDVESSQEVLEKYARDASLLEVLPRIVVFPKNSEDIGALVKWVNLENSRKENTDKLSITPRSAGTCMSGGAIGESIIMDFTRYMNKIHSVEKVDGFFMKPMFKNSKEVVVSGVATLEPGVYYRELEEEADKHSLLLPCYTASKSINAIGGMVGNNSAGEKSIRYGKTEDYVKELKVIFKDGYEYIVKPLNKKELYSKIAQTDFEGEVYKHIYNLIRENEMAIKAGKPDVSKNSAGYYIWNVLKDEEKNGGEFIFDLTKLIVGSQGTLGIVTEITLHLVEKKPISKLSVIFMKDVSRLGEVVDEILVHNPESLESYDDATLKLAIKFFPDFLKKKGGFGMIKFMWSFLPEAMMMLFGGMPKLILLVEFSGDNDREINKKAKEMLSSIKHFGFKMRMTKSKSESEKYWDIRRESFALLRKHVKNKHTAPFIDDFVVNPEHLPEFLPKLNKILDEYKNIEVTVAGHAGNGNFHIIPLMDFSDSKTGDTIIELSKRVYKLVLEYKGSITGEHNDGLIRTPFLLQMYGQQVYNIFRDIKKIFDPQNMFNPRKKIGEGFDYIREHIIKESHDHDHRS